MPKFRILHHSQLIEALKPFFPSEKLWDAKPHEALRLFDLAPKPADAALYDHDVKRLKLSEFSRYFLAGLLARDNFGQMAAMTRAYIDGLVAAKDLASLISITNYLFKALALQFTHADAAFEHYVLRLSAEMHRYANVYLHALASAQPAYAKFPQQIDAALAAFPAKLPDKVVFVFLTPSYIDNLALWLPIYLQHDRTGRHLLVATLGGGESVVEALRLHGASEAACLDIADEAEISACGNGGSLRFLWYVKIHIVNHLVQSGRTVIYSDLDAYWMRDFHELCWRLSAGTADVVFSVATDMPRYVLQSWGYTPCAGFFAVFPTPAAAAFVSDWLEMTRVMFDDQIAAAEMLSRNGVLLRAYDSQLFQGAVDYATGEAGKAHVAFLSDAVALRVGKPDPATIGAATIWHPRWILSPQDHGAVLRGLIAARSQPGG